MKVEVINTKDFDMSLFKSCKHVDIMTIIINGLRSRN